MQLPAYCRECILENSWDSECFWQPLFTAGRSQSYKQFNESKAWSVNALQTAQHLSGSPGSRCAIQAVKQSTTRELASDETPNIAVLSRGRQFYFGSVHRGQSKAETWKQNNANVSWRWYFITNVRKFCQIKRRHCCVKPRRITTDMRLAGGGRKIISSMFYSLGIFAGTSDWQNHNMGRPDAIFAGWGPRAGA